MTHSLDVIDVGLRVAGVGVSSAARDGCRDGTAGAREAGEGIEIDEGVEAVDEDNMATFCDVLLYMDVHVRWDSCRGLSVGLPEILSLWRLKLVGRHGPGVKPSTVIKIQLKNHGNTSKSKNEKEKKNQNVEAW